jgi:hypothetical protein
MAYFETFYEHVNGGNDKSRENSEKKELFYFLAEKRTRHFLNTNIIPRNFLQRILSPVIKINVSLLKYVLK